MEVNKLHFNKLVILLVILYFSKASSIHSVNGFPEEEASGMGDHLITIDDQFRSTASYAQHTATMEEKIKALSKNVDELGLQMVSLLNDNVNLQQNLQKSIEQIVEDKMDRIGQIVEEKLKKMDASKNSYRVNELRCADNHIPDSCYDLKECNSNIYNIMVAEFNNASFPALCDLTTVNGGWTIIQRRQDGSENFYRNWNEYVEGFGRMNGEFFMGLDKLYVLTSLGQPQELYIILEDFEGTRRYARYGKFKVGSPDTGYMLTVGEFSGDAGDCLTQHSGQQFSTKDQDNDSSSVRHCAAYWKGAWWYANCYYSNLNGIYRSGQFPKSKGGGMSWCSFRGPQYSLKFSQMMIRPKN